MSLYTKARRHIDMNRVKELREEKIKKEKIAEIQKQQEEILAELAEIEKEESKYVNWRKELNEMTTADLAYVSLPAMGDVDLGTAYPNFTLSGPSGHGYNSVTRNMQGDRSAFDTIVVKVNSNSSDWEIVNGDEIITYGSGGVGSKTVLVPSISSIYYTAKDDGSISFETTYQRRAPVNVFVSLDDPNASAFVKGGLGGSEERKQQLKDMLDAANELMIKMGLDPSKTSPGDIELAGIWQSPDGTVYSRPPVSRPDTSNWPSIHDKPQPIKFPTPGINRSGQGRGTV